MLWGRIVSVLSQSGVTDTKDETELETSSPPLTQVCQQEIIYITNTTNSNEKIILFSTRNLSEEHKMWLQVYRRSRPTNKTRIPRFRPFLWWSSVSVARNLSKASLS